MLPIAPRRQARLRQSKQTLQTLTRQLDRETIMHETLQLLSAGPRRQASARTSAESDEACQRKTKCVCACARVRVCMHAFAMQVCVWGGGGGEGGDKVIYRGKENVRILLRYCFFQFFTGCTLCSLVFFRHRVMLYLSLIQASLAREGSKYHHGDSRYLLVLTENCDAALDIMMSHLLPSKDTVVIFGSSFPKDQEYTQVGSLADSSVKVEVRRKMIFTYVLGFVVLRDVVKVFPVISSSFARKTTGRNRARSHSGA